MPKYKLYTEERKKSNKCNRLHIEVFFPPNIRPRPVYKTPAPAPTPLTSPHNIGPSNLSFIRIYAKGVYTSNLFIAISELGHGHTLKITPLILLEKR